MKKEESNETTPPSATDDMLADVNVRGAEADQLRTLLGEVAGLAHEVPEPSDDVRALLNGAVLLRPRRRMLIVAAAAGALAISGVSAAAATNRLPDRVQQVVADATGGVIPHPVKPTNPPLDAPGHVLNKPKATKTPKPDDSKTPKPLNSDAPGQLQKLTKPNPTAPGPARPADPGSHGRAHNPDKATGPDASGNDDDDTDTDTDEAKVKATAEDSDEDSRGGSSGASGRSAKPKKN